MEAKEITETIGGILQTSVYTLTFSDEELKEFYLRQAAFVEPLSCAHPHNELEALKTLRNKLKKLCEYLLKVIEHNWDDMAKALQTVSGAYPAQNNISRKEHLRMNESLSEIWELLILLSGNRSEIGKLYNHFNRHYMNVKRLVEREQQDAAQEPGTR